MGKRSSRLMGLALVLAMGSATIACAEDYSKFGVGLRAAYVKPVETVDGRLSSLDLKVSDDIVPGLYFDYWFLSRICG